MPTNTPPYVLELIKKAAEEKATFLDLGNCGLTEVPPEIVELAGHLEGFNLGRNYYNDQGKWIESSNNIGINNFSVDGKSFDILLNLVKLYKLYAFDCELSNESIKAISKVRNLTFLEISGNNVGEIGAKYIGHLTNLKFLGLATCNIENEGMIHLQYLTHLTVLDISANGINGNGVKVLLEYKNIRKLDIWGNGFGYAGAKYIGQLLSLEEMDIWGNDIGDIGAEYISNLSNIKILDVGRNFLTDNATNQIAKLKNLEKLDITYNQLSDKGVQTLITQLNNLRNFYAQKNKTETIEEALLNDIVALKAFFRSKKLVPSNRAKMILVGNTKAGKTTLAQWLTEKKYEDGKDSTHGIRHWLWDTKDKGLKVNIWDFGGQDYFHATHELFLEKESLFLFLKSSDNEKNTDGQQLQDAYWLGYIASHCDRDETPLWYIQTKSDLVKRKFQWFDTKLTETYPVEEQYRVAIKKVNAKVEQYSYDYLLLENNLKSRLRELAKTEIPQSWLKIRDDHLPKWRKQWLFLTKKDFQSKCREALKVNISLLNDLDETWDGLIPHMKGCGEVVVLDKHFELEDYVFLGPEELTKALYEILSPIVEKEWKGKFTTQHLNSNINGKLLLKLLLTYGLVFENPQKKEEFVAPQLLPIDPHIQHFSNLIPLTYAIRFSQYMSRAVITRFITRYVSKDREAFYWRYGVFFKHPDADVHCFVRIDTEAQIIFIHVEDKNGKYIAIKELYRFFSYKHMLNTVEIELNLPFKRTKSRKRLSAKNDSSDVIYENLEWFKEKPEKPLADLFDSEEEFLELSIDGNTFASVLSIQEAITNRAYRVATTKGGEYVELNATIHQLVGDSSLTPKRIFFSYSKADIHYRNELETHLAALKRSGKIDTWYDNDLLGGEKWDKKIKGELQRADIVLLLISPDFMATDYIWNEEIPLCNRENKKIIPIFLRPCDWHETLHEIHSNAGLPRKENWIVHNSKPSRDEGYMEVAKGLREIIEGTYKETIES